MHLGVELYGRPNPEKGYGSRVGDFLAGRASTHLGTVIPSYRPGVTPTTGPASLKKFSITSGTRRRSLASADLPMMAESRTTPLAVPTCTTCFPAAVIVDPVDPAVLWRPLPYDDVYATPYSCFYYGSC